MKLKFITRSHYRRNSKYKAIYEMLEVMTFGSSLQVEREDSDMSLSRMVAAIKQTLGKKYRIYVESDTVFTIEKQ